MPRDPKDPNAFGAGGEEGNRAKFWKTEIERALKREKRFRFRARKTLDRYDMEDERHDSDHIFSEGVDPATSFNMLWANTETLRPAMFAGVPRPIVSRRHKQKALPPPSPDDDEATIAEREMQAAVRDAGKALEECLASSLDQYDFEEMGEECINDHLLPGRMVARVRYRATADRLELERREAEDGSVEWIREGNVVTPDEVIVDEDVERGFIDDISLQQVWSTHVQYDRFIHAKATSWRNVWWIGFEDFLNRDQVAEQFGEAMADKIKYSHDSIPETGFNERNPKDSGTAEEGDVLPAPVARFYEIWNKRTRQVIIWSDGLQDELVASLPDPLSLRGFYPMPAPVFSVPRVKRLEPMPEFMMYKAQADELDVVTTRRTRLVAAIKAVGAYDQQLGNQIAKIFDQKDLTLVPIENYAQFREKGGLASIDWLKIEEYSKAVDQLTRQANNIISIIFQITGLSDLLRGDTDPRETARAQSLKAQFGSRRIVRRQKRVERFWRDLYRLKAEIIAENFTKAQIELMSGMRLSDLAIQVLRADAIRDFLVDVETQDTAAPDEQQNKRDVTELFQALGNFFAAAQGLPPQIAITMVLYAIKQFRAGRDIEDLIAEFGETLKQREEEAARRGPPPDPEVLRAQAEAAEKERKLEMDRQIAARDQRRKDEVAKADIDRQDAVALKKNERERRALDAKISQDERALNAKIALMQKETMKQLQLFELKESIRVADQIQDKAANEDGESDGESKDDGADQRAQEKLNDVFADLIKKLLEGTENKELLNQLVTAQEDENDRGEKLLEIGRKLVDSVSE